MNALAICIGLLFVAGAYGGYPHLAPYVRTDKTTLLLLILMFIIGGIIMARSFREDPADSGYRALGGTRGFIFL